MTSSRKIILDIVMDAKKGLTAEEIFNLAHSKDSGIGLATVYRNISLLEKFNIINKSFSGNKKKAIYYAFHDAIREKETELEEMIEDFGKIDRILSKYDFDSSYLIQILIDFQIEYNWLPKHVLFYTANKLNIQLEQIYSIATFYRFFNLEPKGKYQILVCAGTACHVRGSMNLLQRIVNLLKIDPGDTTADMKFSLDTVNCLGCCALGPVMLFNNKYYSNPNIRQLEKLFNEIT